MRCHRRMPPLATIQKTCCLLSNAELVIESINIRSAKFRVKDNVLKQLSRVVWRSAHAISMNEWHVIWFWRTGRKGFLKVDKQPLVESMSSGAFTQLTLTLDLFIGGHRNFDEVAKAAWVTSSFSGCIQKVSSRIIFQCKMLFLKTSV